jgi:hypothetical protein
MELQDCIIKIYVSGKITGDPNHRARFELASLYLQLRGYQAVNPIKFCFDASAISWRDLYATML